MSDKYTPDTEAVVRDYVAYLSMEEGEIFSGDPIEPEVAEDRIRRWLAREKAEAVREAAEQIDVGFNQETLNLERRQIKRWLRDYADRLARGEEQQ